MSKISAGRNSEPQANDSKDEHGQKNASSRSQTSASGQFSPQDHILHLQQTHGNRFVMRFLNRTGSRGSAIQRDTVEEEDRVKIRTNISGGGVESPLLETLIQYTVSLIEANEGLKARIIDASDWGAINFDISKDTCTIQEWIQYLSEYDAYADLATLKIPSGSGGDSDTDESLVNNPPSRGLTTPDDLKVDVKDRGAYKKASEMMAMKVWQFSQYTSSQVDWYNAPAITPDQKAQLRTLAELLQTSDLESGCGELTVQALFTAGLIDPSGKMVPAVFEPLQAYSAGVRGSVPTIEIKAPVADLKTMLDWGKAMKNLAEALGGSLAKKVIPQPQFQALITKNKVDAFINYFKTCAPYLEADNGSEINSYLDLWDEGVDPASYKSTNLDGWVRNFHRFQREALDILKDNFNEIEPDAAKRHPLTLILHSIQDHNGAFHRDPFLTTVIKNGNILTLLIEGKETLDEVKDLLGPLALKYGKDNKVDQVMFAGHGNARSIELGTGEIEGNAATVTLDFAPTQEQLTDGFIPLTNGASIEVANVWFEAGQGHGTSNGVTGYFPIDNTSIISEGRYGKFPVKVGTPVEGTVATATEDYDGSLEYNLSFKKDDRIDVDELFEDLGLGMGSLNGANGTFPLDKVALSSVTKEVIAEEEKEGFQVTATHDFNLNGEFPDKEDTHYLKFKKGDTIIVTTVIIQKGNSWPQGYVDVGGKHDFGTFPSVYSDLKDSETVNLDSNAQKSDALFDELLKNMANDPSVAPHRRIVFNACLTNSNEVSATLVGDVSTMQQQVRDSISKNSSLATYVKARANKQGLKQINVLGANGSIGQVKLIDAGDGLDIVSAFDPKVTATDKMDYVAEGMEPQGVLRAVLECWSGFGESTPVAQEQRRQKTFTTMANRIKTKPKGWSAEIIHTLFSVVLDKYQDDAESIRLIGNVAHDLEQLSSQTEARPSKLVRNGMGPGGKLAGDVATIFGALNQTVTWGNIPHLRLVAYQVWMKHEPSRLDAFIKTLEHFNCQTADEFLDIKFLTDAPEPKTEQFLVPGAAKSGNARRGRLILAFRIIDTDSGNTWTRDWLRTIVGKGDRFPISLKVGDILMGKPSENVILNNIGLGAAPAQIVPDEGVKGNLDLDGDGKNETYVEPLTRTAKANGAVKVYSKPDETANDLPDIADASTVYISGQLGDFYAIESGGTKNGTAFVAKTDLTVL